MMRRWIGGAMLVAWGCGGATPTAEADAGASARAAASEPDAGARGEADASTRAAAPRSGLGGAVDAMIESAQAPAAGPVGPLPMPGFHAVVTSEEWLGLHPLLDGTLMISAGPKLLRVDPGGTIHDDPALLGGIELPLHDLRDEGPEPQLEAIGEWGGWWTVQVGGWWPTSPFLTLSLPGLHDEPYALYRWKDDRWAKVEGSSRTMIAYPRAVRAWKDDSVLAWRGFYAPALDTDHFCSLCPEEFYETPEYKGAERAVASAKLLAVLAGPAKGPTLSRRDAVAFDALPSGEAFVGLEGGSILVIAADGTQQLVAASGETAGGLHGLVARGPQEVIGFGGRKDGPLLVRWDGTELQALPEPECGRAVASLSIVGPTWWATCGSEAPRSYEQLNFEERDGSLWRKQGEGGWERAELGPRMQPRQVVARAEDDVWVTSHGKDGTGTVLHTRARGAVIELGGMEEIVRAGFYGRGPSKRE